jgi:hypothetical protein
MEMARKMKLIRHFTITTGISSIFTLVMHVIPLAYAFILVPFANAPSWPSMILVVYTLANMNPNMNAFIYLSRQKDLREAFKFTLKDKQHLDSWL